MKKAVALAAVVAITCLAAPSSYADTVTFDLTAQNLGQVSIGSIGNSLTFTQGGLTVTATAWAATHNSPPGSDNVLAAAALGIYGSGLGVCDATELPTCSVSPFTDNVGPNNFILFTFSANVDPLSVRLFVNGVDWDVAYRVGNVATPLDLTGLSYFNPDDLAGTFDSWQFAPDGPSPYIVPIGGLTSVNAILIGANAFDIFPNDPENDGFKIEALTVNTVPEPATLLSLGSALTALSMWTAYRRKRN